ncbi:MAG: hypothetical protein AAFW73_11505 [Bacteroidota bacterium]
MKTYIPLFLLVLWSAMLCGQVLTDQEVEIEVLEQSEPRGDTPPGDGQASFGQNMTQESEEDVVSLPQSTPFNSGESIEGLIQGSINEVTGKVAFSVPIASISARTLSYGISLNYSNQGAFKRAQHINQYGATSSLGLGWNLSVPKIVADNKQTGTREDDDFYLIDGSNSTKLICTNRDGLYWEFQAEKYVPWKFYFYPNNIDSYDDYWVITKEDGSTFHFGDPNIISGVPRPNKAREFIVRRGNWIGSSKQAGASSQQTVVWNLYKIEDQWDNSLSFFYDRVDDLSNYPLRKHTEASYLSQIISSNGSKILFNYNPKSSYEYHEPHRENSEPDAYQERYEKKYLSNIQIFNVKNSLIYTYLLGYQVPYDVPSSRRKRYLTSITQRNSSNQTLPPQSFEYNTTGTYKGGLKKVTYPMGGTVTYNYQNKYLFYNGSNRYTGSIPSNSGYYYHAAYVRDNYVLKLYRSVTEYSGQKHRFKIVKHWWNGMHWQSDEYVIPNLVKVDSYRRLENMLAIFEEDFYGVAVYENDRAHMYVWHIKPDGREWLKYQHTYLHIGSERPQFLSGDNFVAIGAHRTGRMYTYYWTGSSWSYKQINQGSGQFYYAANNNFILSLDEDGGPDMVTNISYYDNYYIHYLNAEKRWITKSWSQKATQNIASIEKPSYFYPSNSMAGFVADDNPELFLRWDINYNLQYVDNVLGAYDDRNPIQPVLGSMYTLTWWSSKNPIKTARFNGLNWSVRNLSTDSPYKTFFGEDIIGTRENSGLKRYFYYRYNPNYNNWGKYYLSPSYTPPLLNSRHSGIAANFMIAGNGVYKRNTSGTYSYQRKVHNTYHNDLTQTNSINQVFVELSEYTPFGGGGSIAFKEGKLYYQNKETGNIDEINMGARSHVGGSSAFGGYHTFMSNKSLWVRNNHNQSSFSTYLHRMIDEKVNNYVYNIVVDNIVINDGEGHNRKVTYQYSNPTRVPDDDATFYSTVTVRNRGTGSGNIGWVTKTFNTGGDDLRQVGLPLTVTTYSSSGTKVQERVMDWQLNTKYYSNGSSTVGQGYYVRMKQQTDRQFFDSGQFVETSTSYYYNTYGLLSSSNRTNSKGKTERTEVRFAYQNYSWVNSRHMLDFPYETTSRIDGQITSVDRNVWTISGSKVYPNSNWTRINNQPLRMNSQTTRLDGYGNVMESSNGRGIYNTVLYAYDNLHPVATITNARYTDVINELDVSYSGLQTLSTSSLKTELTKLYSRMPEAMIELTFYDDNGNITSQIDSRRAEMKHAYDGFNRLIHTTNASNQVIQKNVYNYH